MTANTKPSVRVYREGDGWRARAYLGRDELTGKRLRPSKALKAEARPQAEAEARRWLDALAPAAASTDTAATVAAWLDALEAKGKPMGTVEKYRGAYSRYIRPVFAGVPLAELDGAQIERLELSLLRGGHGRAALAPSTVRAVHYTIKGALDWAVKMGRADSNPALSVDAPRPTKTRARALDAADLARLAPLLDAAVRGEGAGTMRGAVRVAAWLMLRCGLRCAEACGLTVRDLKGLGERAPYLTVSGAVRDARGGGTVRTASAKTDRSIRAVSVTARDARALLDYVALHGLAASPASPVATVSGAFLSPSYAGRVFRKDVRGLGLPAWVHPHTLRHTYATVALAAGVDVYTLAESMGHASPSTTLNTYAHEMPGRGERAAQALADALDHAAGVPPQDA